jgi:CheY-like chemotaxis protein
MDIVLKGGIDGIQAAQAIHDQLDIPVIYLTAHSDDTTLELAKVTEPRGYILKPFEDRALRAAIELALYQHRIKNRPPHTAS